MEKTPIQEMISYLEKEFFASVKQSVIIKPVYDKLQSLLPTEEAFAKECFDAGYKRGEDQGNLITEAGNTYPTFQQYYSQFKKQ